MKPLATCRAAARVAIKRLQDASALDEDLKTWDTVRLAKHAVQTAELFRADDAWTREQMLDALYDVIALIRAALNTTTDVISAKRGELLSHAFDAIARAADEIDGVPT